MEDATRTQATQWGIMWKGRRWKLIPYARLVWSEANGPIPIGMIIHHKDLDPLNDHLGNLDMLTVRDHNCLHVRAREEVAMKAALTALEPLKSLQGWTVKEATKLLAISERQTHRVLKRAYHAGAISRVGSGAACSPYLYQWR